MSPHPQDCSRVYGEVVLVLVAGVKVVVGVGPVRALVADRV